MRSDVEPGTVLVADRSPIGRAWSTRLLSAAGHDVIEASDGAETVTIARRRLPEVVVVDEGMPGLSGRDVVAALRGEGLSCGIVLVAGTDGDDVAADALRLGADDALVRPCHERSFAAAVAHAAATGRAREARMLRDQRLDGELRAAAAIQAALLPEETEPPEGYRLDWAFLPAREVGGDLLDVVITPAGGFAITLADVSGKGLGAALISGMARTALRAATSRGDSPGDVLAATGTLLSPDLERTGAFLTAIAIVLDPGSGAVRYADAGHGHHLILTRQGATRALVGGGPPLGLSPDATFESGLDALAPGERLVLFSDGLVDEGEPVTEAASRLVAALRVGYAAVDIVGAAPDDDDRTLIVLEREA